MSLALIGRKIGTTMKFSENGRKIVELTAVLVSPNIVSQVKSKKKEGYDSIQIVSEECKENSLNRPQLNHLKKRGISAHRLIKEVRGSYDYIVGDKIDLTVFSKNEKINVTGTSKGKGFAGVIKRYNHSRGPMAHGSGYHRGVGSMGSIASNKVPKGKKLPGRMGSEKSTVRNIVVHEIISDKNIVLIRGSVPGPVNGILVLSKI